MTSRTTGAALDNSFPFEGAAGATKSISTTSSVNRLVHEKVVYQFSPRVLPALETVFPKVLVTPETVPRTVLLVPVTASPTVFPAP
jgi:hypothetical protein